MRRIQGTLPRPYTGLEVRPEPQRHRHNLNPALHGRLQRKNNTAWTTNSPSISHTTLARIQPSPPSLNTVAPEDCARKRSLKQRKNKDPHTPIQRRTTTPLRDRAENRPEPHRNRPPPPRTNQRIHSRRTGLWKGQDVQAQPRKPTGQIAATANTRMGRASTLD